MASPTVSVILPTHNRAQSLPRALESVLNQTFQDFEIIVVDDASSDNTAEVLAPYLSAHVRCIRHDRNRGAAAARNAGIRASTGEFLAFQDSDDEWLPDKLARQVTAFAQEQNVSVVYGDMERVSVNGECHPFPAPEVVTGRIINSETGFYQVHHLGIQSALIRRNCTSVDAVFDERLPALEDLELFLRLSRTHRFHHSGGCVVRYYETPGLSSDDVKRFLARGWLLRLHGRALRQSHPLFYVREWINVQRGKRRARQR